MYLQALRNKAKVNALGKPVTESFGVLWGSLL